MNFLNSIPFFCLFYVIAVVLIVLFKFAKTQKIKVLLVNFIFLFLFFSVMEVVCYFLNCEHFSNSEYVKITPDYFYRKNDILGYLPFRNIKAKVEGYFKKRLIYNVTYTINDDYLRVTPSSNEKSDKCVLFFGCSYTFGSGLNDDETLPYYLGEKSEQKYRIYNFGFPGYGPHQMLATLEQRNIKEMLHGCKETIIMYSGISDHLPRTAGVKYWQKHEPKYSLQSHQVVYQGHFDDNKVKMPEPINNIMCKLQMYVYVKNKLAHIKEQNYYKDMLKDKDLYIGILDKSRELAMQKYNVKRFIVLYWSTNYYDRRIQSDFEANHFEYYIVNDILNIKYIGEPKYFLQDNFHPNKFANEKLSEFLTKILTNN